MTDFWNIVRADLGRLNQGQVDGIEAILRSAWNQPVEFQAYILATAWHETARTMQPVRETLAKTDASAVNILERAWAAGKLPTVRTPYWRFDQEGKTWLGRGYVQLTHKANYIKASQALNIDLLTDPNRAMVADTAGAILVRGCVEGWFTGKKLGDYLPGDYINARRVVNGDVRQHGAMIAKTAGTFAKALRSGVPVVSKRPEPTTPVAQSIWTIIADLLARLFGGKK